MLRRIWISDTVKLVQDKRVRLQTNPGITLGQARNRRWSTGKTFALGTVLLTPCWEDYYGSGAIHYREALLGGE